MSSAGVGDEGLTTQIQLEDRDALISRIHQALQACSKAVESGDIHESNAAVGCLSEILDSISKSAISTENFAWKENAVAVLVETLSFISSPSLDQAVVDAVSFELPREVAKFAGVSDKCREIVENIIDCLAARCSPRDILSILCEALASLCEVFKSPVYFVSLVRTIAKVFLSIQRRPFEQVKAALPAIVNVLKSIELDDEDKCSLRDLISEAVNVAASIQVVALTLVEGKKKQLQSLFVLYSLQIMALMTRNCTDVTWCIPLVVQLSQHVRLCGVSYLGLVTATDVERVVQEVLGEDDDDIVNSFSFTKQGASLSVIWGHISEDVAKTAGEDWVSLKDKLRNSQTKRWQAVGMLNHIITAIDQPWELKSNAINLLLTFIDGNVSRNDDVDFPFFMPSLFTVLQGLQKIMIYASEAKIRKTAFAALKKVLSDIPSDYRFDILKALITNSDSPSMIAILMDLVKEEVLMENSQIVSSKDVLSKQVSNNNKSPALWSSNALDFVEFILKPSKGGPPSLPEQSEAVLSALNLYRFLLIMEATGKTNRSGVLSKNRLQKAYKEWLLPLRAFVSGMEAENTNAHSEAAIVTICAINPVELVLYHCIELVEERLSLRES